jgi:hypothetical protein
MTFVPHSNGSGALFELVARGQKDKFLQNDNVDAQSAFDNRYKSSAPFMTERRTTVPLNAPRFGNTFEIELDRYGDILLDCALLIDLPYWFPPLPTTIGGIPLDPIYANSQYFIRAVSSPSNTLLYGYTNYIGYLMFESIQFYQDQILIQEWSGESLLCTQFTEGSWSSSFLEQKNAGFNTNINLRATPGQLRVHLPLPGLQTPGDGGFPFCCVPSQNYRLKIKIRPLEDIVVCNDPNIVKPAPWNEPAFTYPLGTFPNYIQFPPLTREQIGQPNILLETQQAYISNETMSALQESQITIPFRKVFENVFTIGELDYKPLDYGGTATITRRLDARHMAERVMFIFRTGSNLEKNRLYNFFNDFTTPTQEPTLADNTTFYTGLKLVIAGQDRESLWEQFIWQDLEALVKDERDNGLGIGEMRWNYGSTIDRDVPAPRQPEGSINFTTADRPTLHIQLTNVPVTKCLGQRSAELRVFIESWNVYEMQQGRGRLLFAS